MKILSKFETMEHYKSKMIRIREIQRKKKVTRRKKKAKKSQNSKKISKRKEDELSSRFQINHFDITK